MASLLLFPKKNKPRKKIEGTKKLVRAYVLMVCKASIRARERRFDSLYDHSSKHPFLTPKEAKEQKESCDVYGIN